MRRCSKDVERTGTKIWDLSNPTPHYEGVALMLLSFTLRVALPLRLFESPAVRIAFNLTDRGFYGTR